MIKINSWFGNSPRRTQHNLDRAHTFTVFSIVFRIMYSWLYWLEPWVSKQNTKTSHNHKAQERTSTMETATSDSSVSARRPKSFWEITFGSFFCGTDLGWGAVDGTAVRHSRWAQSLLRARGGDLRDGTHGRSYLRWFIHSRNSSCERSESPSWFSGGNGERESPEQEKSARSHYSVTRLSLEFPIPPKNRSADALLEILDKQIEDQL